MTGSPASRIRPALRYHGGKWKLSDWIVGHFPPHRVYVEAFAGGASVLIKKPRSRSEVYNDRDTRIVRFFRVLQDKSQASELQRRLSLRPFARASYEWATRVSDAADDVTVAESVVVLSFQGWSSDSATRPTAGGFRAFGHDSNTVPHFDWRGIPENLGLIADRFMGVLIENKPAADIIAAYSRDDTLIYLDPPYLPETRTSGRATYKHEMNDQDHHDMLDQLICSDSMIVLSGYESTLYTDALNGWTAARKFSKAQKCTGGSQSRVEVLWMNPAAADGVAQRTLNLAEVKL